MTHSLMIFQGVVSVLLIIMVLIQFGKGAEAGLMSTADSVFTGSQKGNILTKITIVLSILFLGNSVLLAKFQGERGSKSLLDNEAPIARPFSTTPAPAEGTDAATPATETAPATEATTAPATETAPAKVPESSENKQ